MTVSVNSAIAMPLSSAFSYRPGIDATGKLANYGKLGVTDPDAAIKALFAAGEQGAWYDPSDLTTMFQDRAGTTPVTADGQTVGLILDKSKGLVLGSEQITNGAFTTDTGWTKNSATITGGVVTCNGAAWVEFVRQTMVSPITPTVCKITITVSNYVSGKLYCGVTVGGSAEIIATGNGTFTGYVPLSSTAYDARLYAGSTAFVGDVDNFSIKPVSGNHAVAPSDAARPLRKGTGLSKWIDYDGVDDVVNSTFASSLGASCTVARANVGGAPTILTGQTITTTYASSTDHAGLIIVNRALTADETTNLTTWLTAKGATS